MDFSPFLDYSQPFVYISIAFPTSMRDGVLFACGGHFRESGFHPPWKIRTLSHVFGMKIQAGGLSEGLHEYHFDAVSADIGLGENFTNNVFVDVVLEKTGTQLFLTVSIQATGKFECDRCLSQFEGPLHSSYRMYYLTEGADQTQFDPAEVQTLPPGVSFIDLADDVRQTILLSVPLKILCSNTCEGLCPHCGANLNIDACTCTEKVIDPRWEKLRLLRNKSMQDPT